jgi:hypothetical protein
MVRPIHRVTDVTKGSHAPCRKCVASALDNTLICRGSGVALEQDQPPEDASAVVPEVALLYDEPVGPETQQRHSC